MFSRRGIPFAAGKGPGEWLNAAQATFLMAIPVVSIQFALLNGGLDALMFFVGND